MKSITVFNNKGGLGKATLTYHLGYALAEFSTFRAYSNEKTD